MRNNRLELGMVAVSAAGAALVIGLLDARGAAAVSAISPLLPLALATLPLAAVAYMIARRHVRSLARLDADVAELEKTCGLALPEPGRGMMPALQRGRDCLHALAARVRELDGQALKAESASRLLLYRHEKAQAVLDAMPDGVLVLDHSCVPTLANPRAEALLGVSRAHLVGHPPQKWCTSSEVLTLLMRYTHGSDSAVHTASVEYTPGDQPQRRIAVSVHPLFTLRDSTALFGTLVILRDVSRDHAARRAGAEFVAHVAHELKTPLASLAAYSELLMDFQTLPDAERVNAVNIVRDEVERITALIGNLLNISRLESGTLQPARQRVKIQDLLRDCVESVGRSAMHKRLTLRLDMSSDVGSARLDKDLFRIAIGNLLSNAIKYSHEGGLVTVSAKYVDEERIRVAVTDEGVGVKPEDRDRVFEKHFRSGAAEVQRRAGHGLGLYLAKQIVELHHGTIAVSSEPGSGATFSIEFDARNSGLEEAPQA